MFDVSTRVLREGVRGEDVKFYQGVMNRVAGNSLTTDGVYGPKTKTAVENWQRFFGLYVDGILGPHTQKSMIEVSLATGK